MFQILLFHDSVLGFPGVLLKPLAFIDDLFAHTLSLVSSTVNPSHSPVRNVGQVARVHVMLGVRGYHIVDERTFGLLERSSPPVLTE